MTAIPGPATVAANVLFLRLPGFAGQPVAEQARRRHELATIARSAAAAWAGDARIVLDAPDGLAIVGRGDPWAALEAARLAAAGAPANTLGIGLHHGPVHAIADAACGARLTGDGLDTAASIAGAGNGQHPFLASLPFREAVAAQSPQRASALRPAGEFVDHRLRAHALFAFDPAAIPGQLRRRAVLGAVAVLGILGVGVAARAARQRYVAARRPALLLLDVQPSGEVWVDGVLQGSTPELARLPLPAGPHTIELRNARAKPVRIEVQLQPGEELKVNHVFPPPPPAPAPAAPRRPRHWTDKVEGWVRGLQK
jgi:hypothetical protein